MLRRHSLDADRVWNKTADEVEEELLSLVASGESTKDIAERLGLSITTVNGIRRKHGVNGKLGVPKTNFRVRQKRVLITLSDEQRALAEATTGFAKALAWKFYFKFGRRIEVDELIAEANLGLCMAARLYKPGPSSFKNMCFKFVTGRFSRAMEFRLRGQGFGYAHWRDRNTSKGMEQLLECAWDSEEILARL